MESTKESKTTDTNMGIYVRQNHCYNGNYSAVIYLVVRLFLGATGSHSYHNGYLLSRGNTERIFYYVFSSLCRQLFLCILPFVLCSIIVTTNYTTNSKCKCVNMNLVLSLAINLQQSNLELCTFEMDTCNATKLWHCAFSVMHNENFTFSL